MQSSILSYPSRGQWGKSSYRGNCSGYIIKDTIEQFKGDYGQDFQFLEVFSGGGTGKDVCKDLGVNNSIHLDLLTGWNALVDETPSGNHLTFSHPAYWDIVDYSTQRGEFHADDLSNNMSYDEFINKLNKVNLKIYQSLVNGGRHAVTAW